MAKRKQSKDKLKNHLEELEKHPQWPYFCDWCNNNPFDLDKIKDWSVLWDCFLAGGAAFVLDMEKKGNITFDG